MSQETYTPTQWKDHVVQRPRTYAVVVNDDNTITLRPAFGGIEQAGTPVSAENLNHMEDGIQKAFQVSMELANTIQTVEAEVEKRIPTVPGAEEGHVPVFDENGSLASGGVALSALSRAKFSLSGTTLTITTT